MKKRVMRNYDLTKVITSEHDGKWIALNKQQTKVLASANTYKELKDKISGKEAIFLKAQRTGVAYAY